MNKDEMKNRISLALKDPILQQGFEIICKKNATLKEDYECLEDAHNVLNELYEKLEKENAELKEQCSILADCNTCISTCKTENIEMKKQLTKAKELIRKLIEAIHIWDCKNLEEVEAKAEQFLKEVEK